MRTTYSVPRLLATLLMLIALYGLGVRVCRADEYKIGVINTDRILREAAPAKEAAKKIEQEFKSRDADEKLVDSLVTPGHPSTPRYNDPQYPFYGRRT